MATLRRIRESFHVRFRFCGKPYRRSLLVNDEGEANIAKKLVELTLYRIKIGIIPPPDAKADAAVYIISGGKKDGLPPSPTTVPPAPISLKQMRDDYLASLPKDAKEESSLRTEKTHFKRLLRASLGRPDASRKTRHR